MPFGTWSKSKRSKIPLLVCAALVLATTSVHASLYSLSASGTIEANTSGDVTIPVGTPWAFEVVYDTAAPDLDVASTGSADPTFGLFANTGGTPALHSFHYRAGLYEVAIDDPADFGTGSDIVITFTSHANAIDININAASFFPPLAGGAVLFHADFNHLSSSPIFASDALPTDPALGPGSFELSTVSLLPPSTEVSGRSLTTFTVRAVPEPSIESLALVGILPLLVVIGRGLRLATH